MRRLYLLVTFWVFLPGPTRAEVSAGALGPVAMDSYRQTVLVTFKSEAAARAARLRIAPLYHDLRGAFSTRMDDCNLNDLRVAEGRELNFRKGTNDLRILHAPTNTGGSPVNENNYGCYFRLTDVLGARVTEVRFERPPS